MVAFETSARATAFGVYPSSRALSSTRSRADPGGVPIASQRARCGGLGHTCGLGHFAYRDGHGSSMIALSRCRPRIVPRKALCDRSGATRRHRPQLGAVLGAPPGSRQRSLSERARRGFDGIGRASIRSMPAGPSPARRVGAGVASGSPGADDGGSLLAGASIAVAGSRTAWSRSAPLLRHAVWAGADGGSPKAECPIAPLVCRTGDGAERSAGWPARGAAHRRRQLEPDRPAIDRGRGDPGPRARARAVVGGILEGRDRERDVVGRDRLAVLPDGGPDRARTSTRRPSRRTSRSGRGRVAACRPRCVRPGRRTGGPRGPGRPASGRRADSRSSAARGICPRGTAGGGARPCSGRASSRQASGRGPGRRSRSPQRRGSGQPGDDETVIGSSRRGWVVGWWRPRRRDGPSRIRSSGRGTTRRRTTRTGRAAGS